MKVNQDVYLTRLSGDVLLWVEKIYQGARLVFQQDGAPSHWAQVVQHFCCDMFFNFWDNDTWPPSSPDVNPMDFSI